MGIAPGAEPACGDPPSAAELARQVVRELAPAELPAFDLVAAPYLRNRGPAGRRRARGADDALGSGISSVTGLLTPEIVLVCLRVLDAVGQGAADELRSRSAAATGRLIDKLARRGGKAAHGAPRDPAEVRRLTLEQAAAVGMDPGLAAAVADVVADALGQEPDDS
jgi:hypothetical protein